MGGCACFRASIPFPVVLRFLTPLRRALSATFAADDDEKRRRQRFSCRGICKFVCGLVAGLARGAKPLDRGSPRANPELSKGVQAMHLRRAAAAPHSSTHAPTPALPHAAHCIPSRAGIASHDLPKITAMHAPPPPHTAHCRRRYSSRALAAL